VSVCTSPILRKRKIKNLRKTEEGKRGKVIQRRGVLVSSKETVGFFVKIRGL